MVNTKEYRGVSGIYKITCITNNKVYIGSAVDIGQRWNIHISNLKLGKHHSTYFQNAWNKYGSEFFNFTILEEVVDKNDLIHREQHWLDFYKSYDREYGFNVCPIAGSSLGRITSSETRQKQSRVRKGRILSDEHKKKISESHIGIKHTPESLAKLSASKTGKKRSIEHTARIVMAQSKDWIVTSPTGIQFTVHNLAEFCRQNNLDHGTMSNVAKGRYRHHKGWRCEHA